MAKETQVRMAPLEARIRALEPLVARVEALEAEVARIEALQVQDEEKQVQEGLDTALALHA